MWIMVGYYWGWVILCKIREVSSRVNVPQGATVRVMYERGGNCG